MKPIFEDERLFLQDKLGVHIPRYLWRKDMGLYKNPQEKEPTIRFKITDGSMMITSYKYKDEDKKIIKSFKEVAKAEEVRINKLKELSVMRLIEYINNNKDTELFVVNTSSGKDSTVTLDIWLEALKYIEDEKDVQWQLLNSNTSNDSSDTYLHLKHYIPTLVEKNQFHTIHPDMGYYNWIKYKKNYYIPTVLVRNCCSTYKEGAISDHYDKNKKIVMVLGVRKYESFKRANYEFEMNEVWRKEHFRTSNSPKEWTNIAPIIDWHDEDVWYYLLQDERVANMGHSKLDERTITINNLEEKKVSKRINKVNSPINSMYYKGYHRVGCLICPLQQKYTDELTKFFYPKGWNNWMKILKENYVRYNVEGRLKWTLEEYQDNRWKTGIGKVYTLTNLKATPERVSEVSRLLGISEDMAYKYFNRKCNICDKKLNPTEIGMFLKINGRYENQEDNREYLCKKCLSSLIGITPKEYSEQANEFLNNGCNLF